MSKPNAIIFGGVSTYSRALAAYLVPPDGEPLVNNLLIVDKYSVNPPTTYLGAEFPKILVKPNVSYRQVNLTNPALVTSCFEPPEGQKPYSYVFDLSGETQWDRPEAMQINYTLRVAHHIGTEAARRGVVAYVRLMPPFYECKEKGNHDEKEEVKPDGVLGTWWHETLRTLAGIPDLNLVILRCALVYGPYIDHGPIISYFSLAAVYGYLGQSVKGMWGPGKHPFYTVHIDDIAGALWACAEWMVKVGGRAKADAIAGEELPFRNLQSKAEIVPEMISPEQKVIAPLFNLSDDGQFSLSEFAHRMAKYNGAKFEFINMFLSALVKFRVEDLVEEINEEHVMAWQKMINESNPPIPNTHYSPYTDFYNLKRHVIAFNNEKLKRIVGYKLKRPEFNEETVKEMLSKLQAEGSWPVLEPQEGVA